MITQYFGHYLLNRGLVSTEQLADALEYQKSVHLKIGVLAVNAGYMTAEQVEYVHNTQKKIDRKFGELAVEFGYISEDQLDLLLKTQKQEHLMLGQALIERGYFTLEQLESALNDYKKENGMSDRQFNVIRQNDAEEIDVIFRNFGEAGMSKTYSEYVTLAVKNIIRFVDDNPAVEVKKAEGEYEYDWYVNQEITGEISMHTTIACDNTAFIELAGRFADEKLTDAGELAQASAGEFLNLHNGIFLVNMSNNGMKLDMRPQSVFQGSGKERRDSGYIISCSFLWGKFDIILS